MKELNILIPSARRDEKGLLVLDAVVIHRNPSGFFISSEEHEHQTAGAHDSEELSYHPVEQRGNKKLERIPDERAIEGFIRKREGLIHEALCFACDLLAFEKIVTEALFHRSEDVITRNAMSEPGNKTDIGLAGTGHVENGLILSTLQHGSKLLETTTMTLYRNESVLLRWFRQSLFSGAAKFHRALKTGRAKQMLGGRSDTGGPDLP